MYNEKKLTDSERVLSFRRDFAHPSCRSCGVDLFLSAPGNVACDCGWRIPEALKALLS